MGMIAANAQPILDARRKGMKPAELVLVSLIGRINEENHTVYANPKKAYDWLWARGIEIGIYASAGIDWRNTVRSIASERPSRLLLWDADRKEGADVYFSPNPNDIEKPKSEWQWDLSFLPWLPSQNKEFACN